MGQDENEAGQTPLEIATAPLKVGEVVWTFGDCGPFHVVRYDEGDDEALLCNEKEWLHDRGHRVLETVEGGTPLFEISRARGDDNSIGGHLRDGEHLHALCGRVLVMTLEGEVPGASYETNHAHCEKCLEMRSTGHGPVILEPHDLLRALMTSAAEGDDVDRAAARGVLHDALLERFPIEYGASIADAEAQARTRRRPYVVTVRPIATLNAMVIVRPLGGDDLGTRLSPRGMTDERARRLLEAVAALEPTIWTGAVITYVADPL